MIQPLRRMHGRAFLVLAAGLPADQYLEFVVSDMRGGRNLQIAGSLAPAIHNLLASLA